MDNITEFILAIIFSIIVCTDIITYIIKVEKLEIKQKKDFSSFKHYQKYYLCA